jgi:hypothetical protein
MGDATVAEKALGIQGERLHMLNFFFFFFFFFARFCVLCLLTVCAFRFKGNDARKQNCTAAIAIANVIKSSLGPVGLDKMIVSASGEVMVTNDGATILQQLMVSESKSTFFFSFLFFLFC